MDGLVQREAHDHFRHVLHRFGRDAPALVRVSLMVNAYRDRAELQFDYSNDFHFRLHLSPWVERELRYPPRWDEVRSAFYDLYSTMFEDHLVECDLGRARADFRELMRHCPDPARIAAARQQLEEREEHVRQHHRRVRRADADGRFDVAYARDRVRRHVDEEIRRTFEEIRRTFYGQELTAVAVDEVPSVSAVSIETIHEAMRAMVVQEQLLANVDRRAWLQGDWGPPYAGGDIGAKEAQAKGEKLLTEWLSPAQLKQYREKKHFDVVGSHSGKTYRIHHGRQQNVYELDADGRQMCGWCFLPQGQLVAGDVMLAQKIALETDEPTALKIANAFSDRRSRAHQSRPVFAEGELAPSLFGMRVMSNPYIPAGMAVMANGGVIVGFDPGS